MPLQWCRRRRSTRGRWGRRRRWSHRSRCCHSHSRQGHCGRRWTRMSPHSRRCRRRNTSGARVALVVVDLATAVVVHAVAKLFHVGVNLGIGVVAVASRSRRAVGHWPVQNRRRRRRECRGCQAHCCSRGRSGRCVVAVASGVGSHTNVAIAIAIGVHILVVFKAGIVGKDAGVGVVTPAS